MEEIYDSFEPFIQLEIQEFDFISNRYEVWMEGKLIDSGNFTFQIQSVGIPSDEKQFNVEQKCRLTLNRSLCEKLSIKDILIFDILVTKSDRLQLMALPIVKKGSSIGLIALSHYFGQTTNRLLEQNEPYCCNIFLKKNQISKITFSFDIPERLIEFYS